MNNPSSVTLIELSFAILYPYESGCRVFSLSPRETRETDLTRCSLISSILGLELILVNMLY